MIKEILLLTRIQLRNRMNSVETHQPIGYAQITQRRTMKLLGSIFGKSLINRKASKFNAQSNQAKC